MFIINSHLSKIFLLVWLLLLICSGCLPKPQPQTGDFCGKVIDSLTKEPVPGVAITIGGQARQTGLDGRFSIALLPPGNYQLTMERDWYYPLTKTEHHIGKQDSQEFSLIPLPMEGKILYSGDGTGNWEIYELNLADRAVSRLSNTAFVEINPVKLKDNQLIFQSNRGVNRDDLFISDYDQINNIANQIACCSFHYDDEHPSVDEQGEKLVFKSVYQETDKRQICFYNLTSSKLVGIMEGTVPVTGYNPVINPAGDKIAFVSGDYKRLLIYGISGSSITKLQDFDLFTQHNLKLNNPCWSPDGTTIAIDAGATDRLKYIYTINPGTGDLKQITNSYSVNDNQEHPCWSNDGKLIFFVGTIIYSSREDIYCVKVNDSSSWIMVSGGSGGKKYPSWSGLP